MKAGLSLIILTLAFAARARAESGYDAGYEWAEFNSVDDPARCYDMSGNPINNSPTFTEGCLQYLRDHGTINDSGEARHNADDGYSNDEDER